MEVENDVNKKGQVDNGVNDKQGDVIIIQTAIECLEKKKNIYILYLSDALKFQHFSTGKVSHGFGQKLHSCWKCHNIQMTICQCGVVCSMRKLWDLLGLKNCTKHGHFSGQGWVDYFYQVVWNHDHRIEC